ncbi:MAG: FAD-dependent oxidoreductase [Marichromatium sp.]|nr:FAD-dependent oxidoreductase [Marichromatium sp.]
MPVETIGVIGGGIGGLGAAWMLDARYRVILLERNDYVGGHTHTLEVEGVAGRFPVDTGFMVFNRRNYPLLCAMFEQLGVESYPTSMSFAASLDDGAIEYAGSGLNSLFGQRANLVRPGFWRMLGEILRFNTAAKAFINSNPGTTLTLGGFLERGRYSRRFAEDYLLPMAAAIWSCPTADMLDFPFLAFARFFSNHGLLDLIDRPEWETVRDGSRAYVARILERMRGEVRTSTPVRRVRRVEGGVEVETAGGERLGFDAVVFGCHADQALSLIESPSARERELLGSFRYQANKVYLHTDRTLMPRRRRVWSSWNYLRHRSDPASLPVTITYWMNSLQALPPERDVFVSLNPHRAPARQHVLAELDYDHPLFDARAMEAQQRIGEIQGRDRLWFSGAYLGYGFHEDGLRAALEVAEALGAPPSWAPARTAPVGRGARGGELPPVVS